MATEHRSLGKLERSGWLSQQPESFRDRIAQLGRWMTFARGELLYAVGDAPDAVFGLEDGLLDISVAIHEEEMITIHRGTPGFWIGESALLADSRRGLSISAAAKSRVFRLPGSALRRHLVGHPEDWTIFYKLSHMNTMMAVEALVETIVLPPRERIGRVLLRLADESGFVKATQDDIGSMARMSRSTFRRAFATFIDGGAVRVAYGGLQICDRKLLKQSLAAPAGPVRQSHRAAPPKRDRQVAASAGARGLDSSTGRDFPGKRQMDESAAAECRSKLLKPSVFRAFGVCGEKAVGVGSCICVCAIGEGFGARHVQQRDRCLCLLSTGAPAFATNRLIGILP